MLFPPTYPAAPPSITFISDIFHPLVTPLTTYTYSTGSVSSDKASATDEERLPPGGFSLRHEFPHWFRRAKTSDTCSTTSSRKVSGSQDGPTKLALGANGPSISVSPASGKLAQIFQSPRSESAAPMQVFRSRNSYSAPSILEVLYYVKRAFDDHTTLDQLPLEAAGNLGAWKAWRAHRGSTPQNMMPESKIVSIADNDSRKQTFLEPLSNYTKQQDDWSWEGVWEKRVREGIEASISDVALYGSSAGIDDIVRLEVFA